MSSGRSEAGMAGRASLRLGFGLAEYCQDCIQVSHGTCATAIAASRSTAKSPPFACFEGGDTTLHDSVQSSHSRLWDDPVSSGASSRVSQGQWPGHLSGASCDVSWATTRCAQHSTKTPARQSAGIPTKLHTTATRERIRIPIVYFTRCLVSTNRGPLTRIRRLIADRTPAGGHGGCYAPAIRHPSIYRTAWGGGTPTNSARFKAT